MTMQKQRIRELWKCRHTPALKKNKRPSDRAVQTVFSRELHFLKRQRRSLENELQQRSSEYCDNRNSNIALEIADLIVEIGNVNTKINQCGAK